MFIVRASGTGGDVMKWMIEDLIFLLGVFVLAAVVSFAIVTTAQEIRDEVTEPAQVEESVHLPSKCAEFYDSGTDEWKECMLVEEK